MTEINYSAAELAERMAHKAEQQAADEAAESLQKQLDHPFYKRVDDFRDEVKQETLLKASEKYPEPFNPGSWSIKQLGKHAMSENYDQGNYIVGLMDVAEKLKVYAETLQRDKEFYEEEANFWRLKAEGLQDELAAIKKGFTKGIIKGSVIDERG